jgi:hypothetical protein
VNFGAIFGRASEDRGDGQVSAAVTVSIRRGWLNSSSVGSGAEDLAGDVLGGGEAGNTAS